MIDFTGKNILVTGATGFLGRHIVGELVNLGATVSPIDKNAFGVSNVDITSEKEVSDYISRSCTGMLASRYHGIVNNAGVIPKGDDLTAQEFVETMNVNVAGAYNVIKTVKPFLHKDASIVNVASIYGMVSPDFRIYDGIGGYLYNSSAYGSSKAALIQLTKYFAVQMAPIRVNAISPGGIFNGHEEEFVNRYSDRVPLARMAEPEEIVNSILFLLSSMSSYITGTNLVVDGGLSVW